MALTYRHDGEKVRITMKIRDFLTACADASNLALIVKLPDGTEYFDGTPGELDDDLWTADMESWEISGGNSMRGFTLEITLAGEAE